MQALHSLVALFSAALKLVYGELAWEACEKLVHTLEQFIRSRCKARFELLHLDSSRLDDFITKYMAQKRRVVQAELDRLQDELTYTLPAAFDASLYVSRLVRWSLSCAQGCTVDRVHRSYMHTCMLPVRLIVFMLVCWAFDTNFT